MIHCFNWIVRGNVQCIISVQKIYIKYIYICINYVLIRVKYGNKLEMG